MRSVGVGQLARPERLGRGKVSRLNGGQRQLVPGLDSRQSLLENARLRQRQHVSVDVLVGSVVLRSRGLDEFEVLLRLTDFGHSLEHLLHVVEFGGERVDDDAAEAGDELDQEVEHEVQSQRLVEVFEKRNGHVEEKAQNRNRAQSLAFAALEEQVRVGDEAVDRIQQLEPENEHFPERVRRERNFEVFGVNEEKNQIRGHEETLQK